MSLQLMQGSVTSLRPKERAGRGAITISGLTKKYGHYTALDSVDLKIEAGEFLSILGPSGSGKSTLLKLIAGFEKTTSGTIAFDGTNVTHLPANRRDVNTVFQSYALFPHMTVAQNVEYPLVVKKVDKAERARRVSEALALVELDEFRGRLPESMSGGQRQRAALARALIGRPRVLLLDEPLSALDRRLRVQMQDVLTKLHKELALTFVFVTHDQGEALSMSDRVVLMVNGKLVDVDTPSELYWRPRRRAVAEFMGNCNLVDGEVGSDGRTFTPSIGGFKIPLNAVHPNGRCTAAIRAEAVSVVDARRGVANATVKNVVFHGSVNEVTLDIGREIVALQPAIHSRSLQRGQPVRMEVDSDGVSILQN